MTPVRIPPMLRDQVEGQREVLGEGETVRQVLEDVTARYPALWANLFEQGDLSPFVNVYVGRDDVRTLEGLDTPVGASSVILLPAMAGGSSRAAPFAQRLADV
jgi:sulfur-carrier protein